MRLLTSHIFWFWVNVVCLLVNVLMCGWLSGSEYDVVVLMGNINMVAAMICVVAVIVNGLVIWPPVSGEYYE